MADHTRFKDLHEAQEQLEHVLKTEALKRAISEQTLQDQISVTSMVKGTRVKDLQAAQKQFDKFLQSASMKRRAAESKDQEQFVGSFSQTPGGHVHGKEFDLKFGPPSKYVHSPLPRIDFPRFDGSNPRAWMLKCSSFFRLMPSIPDAHKINLASMNFDGKALSWFQQLNMGEIEITWKQFLEVVSARFEMMPISHIILEFNELKQNGSYDDYVEKFEELSAYMLLNDSNRYSEDYFIAHFMSGLSEELQSFLHIFQPRTLVDTIELGRKHLTTLDVIARKMKVTSRVPLPTPVPAELPPTKLLTSFEMAARIEKGLCSNCDEPFVSGHRCKQRINYVLMTEEEELLEAQAIIESVNQHADGDIVHSIDEVPISLHPMMGNGGLTTMRVVGDGKDHKLNTFLVTGPDADESYSQLKDALFSEPRYRGKVVNNCNKKDKPPDLLQLMERYVLILGRKWLKFCTQIEFDYANRSFFLTIMGKRAKLHAVTTVIDGNETLLSSHIHEKTNHMEAILVLLDEDKLFLDSILEKAMAFTSGYWLRFCCNYVNMISTMSLNGERVTLQALPTTVDCKGVTGSELHSILHEERCNGIDIIHVVKLSDADSTRNSKSELLFALNQSIITTLEKVGIRAYRLDLLESAQVHPLWCVEQNCVPAQFLIPWLNAGTEFATCEVEKFISSRFPSFDPRGRGSSQDGGIVMYCEGKETGGRGNRMKNVVDGLKYIRHKISSLDPRGRGSYQPGGIVMNGEDWKSIGGTKRKKEDKELGSSSNLGMKIKPRKEKGSGFGLKDELGLDQS